MINIINTIVLFCQIHNEKCRFRSFKYNNNDRNFERKIPVILGHRSYKQVFQNSSSDIHFWFEENRLILNIGVS